MIIKTKPTLKTSFKDGKKLNQEYSLVKFYVYAEKEYQVLMDMVEEIC